MKDILERDPELDASDDVLAWLSWASGAGRSCNVSTGCHDGHGWWVLHTIAGPLPEGLSDSDLLVAGGRQLLCARDQDLLDADGLAPSSRAGCRC